MVTDIHPKGMFKDESPSLSYIWKWMKKMLNEYMGIKVLFLFIEIYSIE